MAGIQKFKIEHSYESLGSIDIGEICTYKLLLLENGFIGKLTDEEPVKAFRGYDCGNVSIKVQDSPLQILISGSQTSSKTQLSLDDFSIVYAYNPKEFLIKSKGAVTPSSEAGTHWSAYQANPDIKAVIHAHIFNYDPLIKSAEGFFIKNLMPLTHSPSKYSSEMGYEIINIINAQSYKRIIGMLNHDGGFGLIAMGKNLDHAYRRLIDFHARLKNYHLQGH